MKKLSKKQLLEIIGQQNMDDLFCHEVVYCCEDQDFESVYVTEMNIEGLGKASVFISLEDDAEEGLALNETQHEIYHFTFEP